MNRIGRHCEGLFITVIRVTNIWFNVHVKQIIIVRTMTLISPMEIVWEFFSDSNLLAIKQLQDL